MTKIINLEQYKGTTLEKGFYTELSNIEKANQILDNSFSVMENNIVSNFEKGLIEEDVMFKALDELDIIKGKKAAGEGAVSKDGKRKKVGGKWVTNIHQSGKHKEVTADKHSIKLNGSKNGGGDHKYLGKTPDGNHKVKVSEKEEHEYSDADMKEFYGEKWDKE